MPIRLTAIGGPLDGQVFEYGKVKSEITIGRLEDRDIRFPADFRSISRAHCAIVFEGDRYRLRPDEPVFVDGKEAMRDDALPRRCELRIGAPDGPGFKVEWNVLSDMPSTQAPFKRTRTHPFRAAMRSTARARLIALAAAGLVVVLAVGAAAYVLTRPAPITDELAQARPTVYMVVLRNANGFEANEATAWVVAPATLATNAHVVVGIEDAAKKGFKAFIRSSVPPYETFPIVAAIKHPHYLRFHDMVGHYAPVAPGGRLVRATLGYDVGILRVAPGTKLAPPLRRASEETLYRLEAGQEIGYVGYPSERMEAGGVNVSQPTPQIQIAHITAVTDYFLAEGAPKDRLLIQHSLPGTGGASGSPVFNDRGEVIALFNAVNFAFLPVNGQTTRIPSVLVNFAQRVDLLDELLRPQPAGFAESRDAEWQRRLQTLESAPDFLIHNFQRSNKTAGAKAAFDKMLVLGALPGVKKPAAMVDFAVPGSGSVLFQAYGEDTSPLFLFVLDAADHNKVLAHKTTRIHYPWVVLTEKEAAKVAVAIVGEAAGKKVRLRIYFAPKTS
jgi:V8-like Glu-specific endopeptidase